MKPYLNIFIVSIFVSSVNASNLCDSFIKEGKNPSYLQLDLNICAFDITDLNQLSYLDSRTAYAQQFGDVTILKGEGDNYAILIDLESTSSKLMNTKSGVHSEFIFSAFAWCIATPWCSAGLVSTAWGLVKWAAQGAAYDIISDKVKDTYRDWNKD